MIVFFSPYFHSRCAFGVIISRLNKNNWEKRITRMVELELWKIMQAIKNKRYCSLQGGKMSEYWMLCSWFTEVTTTNKLNRKRQACHSVQVFYFAFFKVFQTNSDKENVTAMLIDTWKYNFEIRIQENEAMLQLSTPIASEQFSNAVPIAQIEF